MFILLLLMVTVVFAAWVVIRWSKVKKYWKEKGVPHYTPNPIVGSLTFLQRENPVSKILISLKLFPYSVNSETLQSLTEIHSFVRFAIVLRYFENIIVTN